MTRILHVTEAMSTGVLTFVDSISRRQAAAGAEVEVLYAVRPETPARADLEARFDPRVRLLPPVEADSGLGRVRGLYRALRERRRAGGYDVVHLHSSIAGGLGRLTRGSGLVAYSPHGFAFLRENASTPSRVLTRLAERLLARRSVLVVTSATEVAIATDELRAPRVEYLQSGVPSASIAPAAPRDPARPLRVTMLGRIAYQKAPWRFAAVARELADLAEFLWVGGGTEHDRQQWIGDAPVTVREWVDPDELEEILAGTDVLLFATLWEGMSLSLIQAQGRGIPAVTSDIVGNRDTVRDGVTGFVRSDDHGFVEATRALLVDDRLRTDMGDAARAHILANFTDDAIGTDSMAVYDRHR